MSIKVDLAGLGAAMAEHDFAYLLSPGRERPHVVAVVPRLVDGTLVVDAPGRSATELAAEHPAVTLVFPPRQAGGYTLIVDGDASVPSTEPARDGGGGASGLSVRPGHAVLHRPATPTSEPSPTGCGSDCRPLDVPGEAAGLDVPD
ncbi:hypothetical protein ATJ97_3648 [Georgenia soli]|uniref:Pyridoxamine 5'-phosphate oxidase n=1 Tax=Georgenia soli TaxID=638953 RepID=A0A2A9ES59_9MICO|nr:hypothetical protein [Georgenia soli]PFG41100.1 hypothetical protein ATJ97_3648 [Georgenia soli]